MGTRPPLTHHQCSHYALCAPYQDRTLCFLIWRVGFLSRGSRPGDEWLGRLIIARGCAARSESGAGIFGPSVAPAGALSGEVVGPLAHALISSCAGRVAALYLREVPAPSLEPAPRLAPCAGREAALCPREVPAPSLVRRGRERHLLSRPPSLLRGRPSIASRGLGQSVAACMPQIAELLRILQ